MFAWLSTFSISKVLEKLTVSTDQIIQALRKLVCMFLYNNCWDSRADEYSFINETNC